jgi:hypothetical protein
MLLAHGFPRLAFALTVSTAAIGCGGEDVTVPPTTGALEVTTSTSGAEPDADGYVVQMDAGAAQAIGPAATLTMSGITESNHSVQLGEVAATCTDAVGNPRTVGIIAGETTTVSFAVTCSATPLLWQNMAGGAASSEYALVDVWGTSATDVYAVGQLNSEDTTESAVFRYDGHAWSKHTEENVSLDGVWASALNDVFWVGGRFFPEGGYDDAIFDIDGSEWSKMTVIGV